MGKTNFHICIPVDKAMALVMKGKNPLSCSESEAISILQSYKLNGKHYFTGCENEDKDGRCKGHPTN